MLDDFFVRAMIGGVGLAATAAPLGCLIVWRRMAYFGDTMAHSALLGIALAFLLNFNVMLGVFLISALVSVSLVTLQKRNAISSDSLLGILSHGTLALGLVMLAFMTWVRIDLLGFLFGDILAVSRTDLMTIYVGGALVLAFVSVLWRSLLTGTVSAELAEAEGLRPEPATFAFMLSLAVVIAIAMKVVGILLITALLIIPAATARRFASTPEQMVVIAALCGAVSVIGGLFGSLQFDTPSGPSIVVAAFFLFLVSLIPLAVARRSQG